jgi:archaellum component FlaC
MFHLPEEILRKIYEYDSYKEDNWAHIVSDIKISFLHSIEDEIFTIMSSRVNHLTREWNLIKPKLEICFGQNLDEFDEEINELILKTWKKDW